MQPHCVGRTMASASLPRLSTPQFSVQASPTTSSDFHTPLSLVRYCSSLRELKQIHAVAIKTNLQDDLPTITRLVSSCTIKPSEASVAYAHKLFDQNPEPTIVLFNILSRGYSRLDGDLSIKAVYLFSRVLSAGLAPDFYTFPSLLKACAASMALEEGRQLHGLALKLGIVGSNIFVLYDVFPVLIFTARLELNVFSALSAKFVSIARLSVIFLVHLTQMDVGLTSLLQIAFLMRVSLASPFPPVAGNRMNGNPLMILKSGLMTLELGTALLIYFFSPRVNRQIPK
ncbi:hypothetical protein SAY87_024975 [Trapa incisa]|uniref:Pentatricopeptide repeat-containing protein n=1 Tax=Trapa incisa TaxID=236973 RepID=A0AAN7GRW9_9MYRT|nr:hypothetical protein SAY87_024975 [Trapa incisa]